MIQCDDKDLFNNYLTLWVAITHGATNSESAFELTDKLLESPFEDVKIPPQKLSEAELKYMYRLYKHKLNVKQIAQRLGIPYTTVHGRIRAMEKQNQIRIDELEGGIQ